MASTHAYKGLNGLFQWSTLIVSLIVHGVRVDRRLGGDSDREIVSFRSCVRAVWLPGGIRAQMTPGSFPFSLLPRRVFPFPLWGRAFSLFPM